MLWLAYIYFCVGSMTMGAYIGFLGPLKAYTSGGSPWRTVVMLLALSAPLIMLYLEKSYGFIASQAHIGGVAISFLVGFLIGAGMEAAVTNVRAGTVLGPRRFDKILIKVSAAIISAVWGTILGSVFPMIQIRINFPDGYVSIFTVGAIIFGWVISTVFIRRMSHMSQYKNILKQSQFRVVAGWFLFWGVLHLMFLLVLNGGGFAAQGLVAGLMGVPAVVVAALSGIDPSL